MRMGCMYGMDSSRFQLLGLRALETVMEVTDTPHQKWSVESASGSSDLIVRYNKGELSLTESELTEFEAGSQQYHNGRTFWVHFNGRDENKLRFTVEIVN